MKARIKITLKNGVLDPQGKAIGHALSQLGYDGLSDIRQGKYIELDIAETDPAKARGAVEEMCERVLANTVIENYDIELDGA
ncbi:MAG: phosphoribosylformylglycinamidine synthase [Rhodobiaceae bacterium]|nr:phosphoribosylformylglycinamidine synthase subunit PurS [Rhodobiaceae bacterium]PCJ71766.1 MAG: phosphoribosylformylglycinamidine synthase [Rhodobiaceae bacterium]